jgi:aerobic carbon-monoxide dehydrogenase small subunit
MRISFILNGKRVKAAVSPEATLLELLRDGLYLTGTKQTCGRGECGACTILLDGKPLNSCLLYAIKANGRTVMTIEGLAPKGELHPLQEAFINQGAVQCGFCTPGMIMAAKGFLDDHPDPTKEEVAGAISGNLCRCGGYNQQISAILEAAGKSRAERGPETAETPLPMAVKSHGRVRPRGSLR